MTRLIKKTTLLQNDLSASFAKEHRGDEESRAKLAINILQACKICLDVKWGSLFLRERETRACLVRSARKIAGGSMCDQAYGEGEGHFLPSLQYIPGFSEFLLMARDRGPGPLISSLSGLRGLTFLLV